MRCKTLILYYNFFVNAACYYGLSMNIGDLGGDIFLNFSISGLSVCVILFASFLCQVHFITVSRILIRNIFHGSGFKIFSTDPDSKYFPRIRIWI